MVCNQHNIDIRLNTYIIDKVLPFSAPKQLYVVYQDIGTVGVLRTSSPTLNQCAFYEQMNEKAALLS